MKQLSYCIAIFLLLSRTMLAQVGINTDNSSPDPSAMLDIKSTTSGVLLPRMSFEQRNAIQNPVEGLMVVCSNCSDDGSADFSIFKGGKWMNVILGCNTPLAPAEGTHIPDVTQIIWKWNPSPIALGYKWNTSDNYNTAIDVGNLTTYAEDELTCFTNYSRYVWAYNTCGQSTVLNLSQSTSMVPFTLSPEEGTHIALNIQIIWNWSPVEGAVGYKLGSTNDFTNAIDKGLSTSHIETGLVCGSFYTRYVWAYDVCGYSTPVILNQNTMACYPCYESIIINHVTTNGVAPVDKTVTYEVAANIPGAVSKCWITSNLGADHQATAVDDATEASAGWYWQFNRKQGYKNNGTTVTPSWPVQSIVENSDWVAANDPCTIEFGAGWRIPTSTEWFNVDLTGNWNDWNGPFGSALKIHAAGNLIDGNGSLYSRGSWGYYRSSTQVPDNGGWVLAFTISHSNVNNFYTKAGGFSIRCLRDN